jgi:hypothetical protein
MPHLDNVNKPPMRLAILGATSQIAKDLVQTFNWQRNKNTLEFLSVWEDIYNPTFNSLEFEEIKKDAGLNRFTMSVKQMDCVTHHIHTSSIGAVDPCDFSQGHAPKGGCHL